MGFSADEVLFLDKKIAAGVVDAGLGQWYDSQLANIPAIFNKNVLTEFSSVPQAANKATAQANAAANPTLISDKSINANAVRLTVVQGSNNSTYVATSIYGNYGEDSRLRNWIHPTRVPLANGQPSVGYVIRVFQGNPAAGGTEILTTSGLTGSGQTATPAWIFNYDQGILLISADYRTTLTNPYILGFRYTGKTLVDTLASLGVGSSALLQTEIDTVESGSGLNTDGSYPPQTTSNYLNSSTNLLQSTLLLDTALKSLSDTVTGLPTEAGKSAYEIAVLNGFVGTEAAWLLSLQGATGAQGLQGIAGADGAQGVAGAEGKSAYALAVEAGFSGTFESWLLSLQGAVGATGADGKSAYELAVLGGFVGSVSEWLLSLVGIKGDKGDAGKSAYEIAVTNGFIGTEVEWLASLKGADGTSGATSLEGIFILDVTPTTTGIVGNKNHPQTVPANKVLTSCITDTPNVRVTVGINGSAVTYSPIVTIAGVTAVVTETSTLRWFTAVADIIVSTGTTTVSAVSNTGATTSFDITLAGEGPAILSATIGNYPNSQTSLKAGDIVPVTITTEAEAIEVQLLAGGAAGSTVSYPVVSNQAICNVVIGNASGSQVLTFKAKNSFGTYGDIYNTTSLTLDQIYPTFGALSVIYPLSKAALDTGDSATVTCAVNNATTVTYAAVGFTVPDPTLYSLSKIVNLTSAGYVDSGTNYTITAVKASNNSTSVKNGLVKIATSQPTASITITPSGRLVGSATGVDYTVTITSTQNLNEYPSLTASAGVWLGTWGGSNKVWTRLLRITDATAKGAAFFSDLTLRNQALVTGTTITSGANYTVGGFTSRTLTFPAFSRVVAIGANVADESKTSCQLVGGNTLTRYSDNTVRQYGYYIANSDGSYNATGDYLGLSDSAFAGANTSGTLQATLAEVA